MSDHGVFTEVQAALLNSDCDPNDAGMQGLCALYTFVSTELEGSPLAGVVADALAKVWGLRAAAYLPREMRAEFRKRVLGTGKLRRRKRKP
jgi:hypothetical protein